MEILVSQSSTITDDVEKIVKETEFIGIARFGGNHRPYSRTRFRQSEGSPLVQSAPVDPWPIDRRTRKSRSTKKQLQRQAQPGNGTRCVAPRLQKPFLYFDRHDRIQRRHHLHESVIQKAVKDAVRAARIIKPATCHTLRHRGVMGCRRANALTMSRAVQRHRRERRRLHRFVGRLLKHGLLRFGSFAIAWLGYAMLLRVLANHAKSQDRSPLHSAKPKCALPNRF